MPFPLSEVVWDYQILGSTPGGELEVLLVAIKADIVDGLFRVTEATKLSLQLCDVSPAALCPATCAYAPCSARAAVTPPRAGSPPSPERRHR